MSDIDNITIFDNLLSTEQIEVIKNLKNYNVCCDSVAGSGKTTTILGIAKVFKNDNICVITYNAKLKEETRIKVEALELHNVEVNSYHSFCNNHYLIGCDTDIKINKVINDDLPLRKETNYTLLIIDEIQDITPLYYDLVCKLVADNNKILKVCIFGDTHQSIFTYNGADERFIEFADILFRFNTLKWKKVSLSTSYRTTKPIAEFLNKCILNEDKIKSVRDSSFKPRYVICDPYMYNSFNKSCSDDMTCFNEVKMYLDLGYKPGDIFIIAPSVKINSPIRPLIDKLCNEGIKSHINIDNKISKDAENKIVFITYHKAKGLERKVCIVYGVDNSYFDTFGTDEIDSVCPNAIYVALTRSVERLSIIKNKHKKIINFINPSVLVKYCDIINDVDKECTITGRCSMKKTLMSDELCNYTKYDVLKKCIDNIKYTINEDNNKIKIRYKILDNKIKAQSIPSDIVSKCLYDYYLYTKYQLNIPYNYLDSVANDKGISKKKYNKYNQLGIYELLEQGDYKFNDFLKLYHLYHCIKYKNEHELNTIYNYDNVIINDGIFDNLDKIFTFKEFNRFNKMKFIRKTLTNNIINLDFDYEKMLQDIIDDFDISILFDTATNKVIRKNKKTLDGLLVELNVSKEEQLEMKSKCNDNINKSLFNTIETNYKILLKCHIDLLVDNVLYVIDTNEKEINDSTIICACICAAIFNKKYNRQYSLILYNPFIDKRYILTYQNMLQCYSLLILNHYIGFNKLTTKTFVNDQLKTYKKYFIVE